MDLDTDAFEQALESSLETMDPFDGVDENPLLALQTELDLQLASIPDIQLQPDEESESFDCPHLSSALAVEAHKSTMLRKYKSAVAWAAHNSVTSERPRKKRKVRMIMFDHLPGCHSRSPPNLSIIQFFVAVRLKSPSLDNNENQ